MSAPAPGSPERRRGNLQPGTTVGRLVLLAATSERRHKGIVWKCQCECGNEVMVVSSSLRRGSTQSCGCLRREAIAARAKNRTGGRRFGRLTATRRVGTTSDGQALWLCECECGTSVEVRAGQLHSGKTASCGCLKADRTREVNSRQVVGYTGAHARVRRERGSASGYSCVDCQSEASDWSYNHLDVNEVSGVVGGWRVRWSMDPSFYEPRCRTCHNRFDHPAKADK